MMNYANTIRKTPPKQLDSLIASLPITNQPIIDRLVILGDWKHEELNTHEISHHLDYCDIVNSPYPYDHKIRTASGLHVQVAHKSKDVQNVRIEYNPSKFNPEGTLLPLLLAMLKYKRISRIDYAIDYEIKLSDYTIQTERPRKSNIWKSPTGTTETIYLGTRTSGNMYRIYDKATEQETTGTLWRIEQELHLDKNTDWWQLQPFADLHVNKPHDQPVNYIDGLVLADLNANPHHMENLSDFLRRKYTKLMRSPEYTTSLPVHPLEDFLAGYQPLADYITNVLD